MCRYTAEVGPEDNSSEDAVWMGSETVSSSLKTKMPLSRRNYLKSLLLQIGQSLVEQEAQRLEREKQSYVDENCPSLSVPHSVQELQELCRKLHKEIDLVDEERYDLEIKVTKSDKEIDGLKIKLQELNGRFQKPVLRKVRMSADAMLAALLGSKHKVSMDLRGNLRQVKKATKEEVVLHLYLYLSTERSAKEVTTLLL
uniref:Troponin I n=1 Tax=Neogobius melanostomus TaxID=47308 RepID=A0A8C6TFB4_9GOBI